MRVRDPYPDSLGYPATKGTQPTGRGTLVSIRSSGSRMRVAITAAAGLAVLVGSVITPLASASAQTLPGPAARPSTASTPQSSLTPQEKAAVAAARRSALTRAAATEKTASYRVSPAVMAFLNEGLGMRLGSSTLLTGLRSGEEVRISLPAPANLPLGLPAGIHQPKFGRSTLVIDQATGAATLTASSADGTVRVAIPDAATLPAGSDLSGDLSVRIPVLGQTVSLSGQVSDSGDQASVALSGHLAGAVSLQHGVAELGRDAEVTLSSAGGLRLFGPALLGAPGHQLGVPVSGVTDGKGDWTFTVRPGAVSASPLPGLALSPAATGVITSRPGGASFDVTVPTARPWTPIRGVSVSGSAVFANTTPAGSLIPAPGIAARTPWIDVTGTVTVASATASTVATHGAVAINLASGKGIVEGASTTPVALAWPTAAAGARPGRVPRAACPGPERRHRLCSRRRHRHGCRQRPGRHVRFGAVGHALRNARRARPGDGLQAVR